MIQGWLSSANCHYRRPESIIPTGAAELVVSGCGRTSSHAVSEAQQAQMSIPHSAHVRLFTADLPSQEDWPRWYYQDLHGELQGPFDAATMSRWCGENALPLDLKCTSIHPLDRGVPNLANFQPLQKLLDNAEAGVRYTPLRLVKDTLSNEGPATPQSAPAKGSRPAPPGVQGGPQQPLPGPADVTRAVDQRLAAAGAVPALTAQQLHMQGQELFHQLQQNTQNRLVNGASSGDIHRDLVVEWRKLLSKLGVDWHHLPPWYATRSAQVVSLVKHFTQLRMSESEFVRGAGWQGFVVVRLYTNIPQDDLIQSLSALLGELVWDKHSSQRNGPRTRLYQVFKDTAYGAVWWKEDDSLADVHALYGTLTPGGKQGMYPENANWGVDRAKGAFYVFSFEGATDVLRLLVKFSYVQFGGMVWHQQIGIPMGINPAVYMANYYLFYYEYRFLAQFRLLIDTHPMVPGADVHAAALFESDVTDQVDPVWKSQWPPDIHSDFKGNIAWYVLNQFHLMVRFVDDLTSGLIMNDQGHVVDRCGVTHSVV